MKYRPFSVTPVLNGFMVIIGCQTAVFQTGDALLSAASAYLQDPEMVEKQWLERSLSYSSIAPEATPRVGREQPGISRVNLPRDEPCPLTETEPS